MNTIKIDTQSFADYISTRFPEYSKLASNLVQNNIEITVEVK